MTADIALIAPQPIKWEPLKIPLNILNKGLDKAQNLISQIKKAAQEIFEMIREIVESTQAKVITATINNAVSDLEKFFNIINSIPLLCIPGSYLRVIFGQAQIIAGLIIRCVGELGKVISAEGSVFHAKWRIFAKLGEEHVIHGCLNILRGTGEGYLAKATLGLGNVVLFVPNLKKEFGPDSFSYGVLVNQTLDEETKKHPPNNQYEEAPEESAQPCQAIIK